MCTRGSNWTPACGPSTSPLGVMAVGYNWTCTACGAANAAGTDICRQCGSNAVTSALEIETGANTRRRQQLSAAQKALAALVMIPGIAGVALLWVFNPPDVAWWVGAGLLAACFIVIGITKLLRGRHDP